MTRYKYEACIECGNPLTQEEIENDIIIHNCDQIIEEKNYSIEEFD